MGVVAGAERGRTGRRWRGRVAGACAAVVCVGASAVTAQTTGLPTIRKTGVEAEEIRTNHVGIVTGAPTGVYARLGGDMVRLLDDRAGRKLRISATMGSGSVNNLDDLRNLPGISLAIVQGDVLDAYAADAEQYAWLGQNVRYVGRLHNELLHVVVREGTHDVCDLAGRRINVGSPGSGTRITVQRVFNDLLGLGVVFDAAATEEGFEQLSKQRVDAMAFVVGPPAPIFAGDRTANTFAEQRLALLPITVATLEKGCPGVNRRGRSEATVYEEVALTSQHYPQLIAPNQTIPTLAVPAVLAAYRFDDDKAPRARATATFIQSYLARAADPIEGFGRPGGGFSAQWCGLDVAAPVKRWQRHDAAEVWLKANGQRVRTSVACSPKTVDKSFCLSDEGKAEEFRRRMTESGSGLGPTDPAYMAKFVKFVLAECS